MNIFFDMPLMVHDWNTLKTHHEGITHVKETRIDIIRVTKFEMFQIIEIKTIDEMYSRFTSITNELRLLGKTYTSQKKN